MRDNAKQQCCIPINTFRDEAVESKNAAEVYLAKNRIEMMQVG